MAHTGGPTTLLPGQLAYLPQGTKCDNHPDIFATVRLVGEADSFGYEATDLCATCYEHIQQRNSEPAICDLCDTIEALRPTRDPEEGSAGRVYMCCASCRKSLRDNFLEGHEAQPDSYAEFD